MIRAITSFKPYNNTSFSGGRNAVASEGSEAVVRAGRQVVDRYKEIPGVSTRKWKSKLDRPSTAQEKAEASLLELADIGDGGFHRV